jgi:hypothetical protein
MFERVKAARERLRGYANVTPVMTSRILNESVYLNLQTNKERAA